MGFMLKMNSYIKHYVKISYSNLWYAIYNELLKMYKNTCLVKDKLNGLNTP